MNQKWIKVSTDEAQTHPLYGIRGWLIVFGLGVCLAPLMEVGALRGEAHRRGLTVEQLLGLNTAFETWVLFSLAANTIMAIAVVGLMLSKSRHFRTATTYALLASFPLGVLLAFITGAPTSGAALVLSFPTWLLSCIVWITYLQRSRRVRVTFEHCLLSESKIHLPSSLPANSSDQSRRTTQVPMPVTLRAMDESSKAGRVDLYDPATPAAIQSKPEAASSIAENEFWEQAYDEMNGANRKRGLWAKMFAQANGNEALAQAQYLSARVQQLQAEQATLKLAEINQLTQLPLDATTVRKAISPRWVDVRADFLSGASIQPEDVVLLGDATQLDPSLLTLSDRVLGETLLHCCARHGLKATAILLIRSGANASLGNLNGRKPHELAEDLELRGILRTAANRRTA